MVNIWSSVMKWLNYHHLLYFWKVARTGSVTAAAEELRLAHPTISAQIRTLEKHFGHKLFRQVGRRLQLTESGQLVYRYANDIFSLLRHYRVKALGQLGTVLRKVRYRAEDPKSRVFLQIRDSFSTF